MKKITPLVFVMFLMSAGIAMADVDEYGSVCIELFGGAAISTTSSGEALKGGGTDYRDTSLDNAAVYGGGATYRFPRGLTMGVEVEHYEMELEQDNMGEIGRLRTTPIMFLIGYQGMPSRDGIPADSGWTGHGQVGIGFAVNSFGPGPGLANIDALAGGTSDVQVENGYVITFGGGGDYFFNRNLCASLDVRYMLSRAKTSGWNPNLNPVDRINSDSVQTLMGLKYWFR